MQLPKKAITRRKLYQEIMDQLLIMLREDAYRPGDHLPSERELMEAFDVGRPAIREALQNLERMGLISINHGERARVAEPSFTALMSQLAMTTQYILQNSAGRLEEMKEARLLFEVQMVTLATERATPESVERLEKRLDDHRDALQNLSVFQHRDMQFHREIASMTGNTIFPALSEAMLGWLGEFYRDLVRLPGSEHLTIQEHERILEAIRARDVAAAQQSMTDHLTRANALYRRYEKPSNGGLENGQTPKGADKCSSPDYG